MFNVHLARCGELVAQKIRQDDYIIVLARILTIGQYVDMNGNKVSVTEDTLLKLVDSYNTKLQQEYDKRRLLLEENQINLDDIALAQELQKTIEEFDYLPNSIDHNMSTVKAIVGNVVGRMETRLSAGKLAIFANIKVKGIENVTPVADNRWRNLSVQYNPSTYEWSEVSWVFYGADPDANKVLSAPIKFSQPTINLTVEQKLLNDTKELINKLNKKILVEKRLLRLCKTRQLTKAEAFFIEKDLADIKDIVALNKIFNILDKRLPEYKPKEKFIPVEQQEIEALRELMQQYNV